MIYRFILLLGVLPCFFVGTRAFACAVQLRKRPQLSAKEDPALSATTSAVYDAEDLRVSFLESWAFLRGRDGERVYTELVKQYSKRTRYYHTLRPIRDGHHLLLEYLDLHPVSPKNKALLIVAWWFHESINMGAENETPVDDKLESVRYFLAMAGMIPLGLKDAITLLINSTKDHSLMCPKPVKIIVDVDLAILGAPPKRYKEYETGLRKEWPWLSDTQYEREHGRIMKRFAGRDPIYRIPFFQQRFGSQAENNLARYR